MKSRYKLLVFVLPIAILVFGLLIKRIPFTFDSEYPYLFNGLNTLLGFPVGHVDHPGTTLQLFYGFIIKLHYIIFGTEINIVTDVILNSEIYITAINNSLLAVNFVLFILLGIVTLSFTKSILLALSVQAGMLLYPLNFQYFTFNTIPEAMVLLSAVIFCILIFIYLKHQKEGKRRTSIFILPALIGLVVGFGAAGKIPFLVYLVIPLILLKGILPRMLLLAGSVAGFFIFTLPIRQQYGKFFEWLKTLNSHTGIYGSGKQSVFDFESVFGNITHILSSNLFISLIVLSGIVVLILRFAQKKENQETTSWSIRLLLSVLVFEIVAVVVISKHYDQHHKHYLVTPFSAGSLLLFAIIVNLRELLLNCIQRIHKIMPSIVITLVLIIILINIIRYSDYHAKYKTAIAENTKIEGILQAKAGKPVIYDYGLGLFYLPNALAFGNVYSKTFEGNLLHLFPDTYFYNYNSPEVTKWFGRVEMSDVFKINGSALLLTAKMQKPMEDILKSMGVKASELYCGNKAVYLLEPANR